MSILWKMLVCYLVGAIPLVAIVHTLHLGFLASFVLGMVFGVAELLIAMKWELAA